MFYPYANPNLQDSGTAIFDLYADQTIRYSTVEKTGFRVLRVIFYNEIENGFELIRSHPRIADDTTRFVTSFRSVDLSRPDGYDSKALNPKLLGMIGISPFTFVAYTELGLSRRQIPKLNGQRTKKFEQKFLPSLTRVKAFLWRTRVIGGRPFGMYTIRQHALLNISEKTSENGPTMI
jgi:hypothetical protein